MDCRARGGMGISENHPSPCPSNPRGLSSGSKPRLRRKRLWPNEAAPARDQGDVPGCRCLPHADGSSDSGFPRRAARREPPRRLRDEDDCARARRSTRSRGPVRCPAPGGQADRSGLRADEDGGLGSPFGGELQPRVLAPLPSARRRLPARAASAGRLRRRGPLPGALGTTRPERPPPERRPDAPGSEDRARQPDRADTRAPTGGDCEPRSTRASPAGLNGADRGRRARTARGRPSAA